ncbi:MAG: hypothetical protein R3Y64_11145 [Peptostreptococcaceae bacterium]
MIIIKKFILLVLVFILSSCSSELDKSYHRYVDDVNYIHLVEMLNNPVMDEIVLQYNIISDDKSVSTLSKMLYGNYYITLNNSFNTFSHSINSNSIEVKDLLTNETTIFMENVNINSLDHFSTLILDTYKDEFTYYSMKDFIPLALQLTDCDDLEFYHESDKYSENIYRLVATIDKLNLDNEIHNMLLESNSNYQELYNIDNPKITLMFKTDETNSYFLSSIDFKINDIMITEII